MRMPYPRSTNKTHNLILETLELEEQAGNLLIKIDDNKKKIQKYFDENNLKELTVTPTDSTKVICKKSERVTIKYDVDKLKQKLDNEVFLEVTDRTYTIKNIDEMIKLMKEAGIKSKDFKSLIDVSIKPKNQEIKRLYDSGDITMKQLKGSYTATISKSIKITEESGQGGSN